MVILLPQPGSETHEISKGKNGNLFLAKEDLKKVSLSKEAIEKDKKDIHKINRLFHKRINLE